MKVDWNEFIVVATSMAEYSKSENCFLIVFRNKKKIYFHFLYIPDDDCKILET
jgi:hypothetical protein